MSWTFHLIYYKKIDLFDENLISKILSTSQTISQTSLIMGNQSRDICSHVILNQSPQSGPLANIEEISGELMKFQGKKSLLFLQIFTLFLFLANLGIDKSVLTFSRQSLEHQKYSLQTAKEFSSYDSSTMDSHG